MREEREVNEARETDVRVVLEERIVLPIMTILPQQQQKVKRTDGLREQGRRKISVVVTEMVMVMVVVTTLPLPKKMTAANMRLNG
jgi:hypothetical protein